MVIATLLKHTDTYSSARHPKISMIYRLNFDVTLCQSRIEYDSAGLMAQLCKRYCVQVPGMHIMKK